MIIEIPNDNSIVKWKNDDKDEWKVAEISDLIKAYERPQGDLISHEALKKALEVTQYNDIDDLTRTERLIDNALAVEQEVYMTGEDYDLYMKGYNQARKDFERLQSERIKNETRSNECQCGRIKLLIDVDEELVCKGFEQPLTEEERNILIRAIGNGRSYEERPKGKWIIDEEGSDSTCTLVTCPFCKERLCCKMNFCGNCGADMRGEEENKNG